MTKSTNGFQSLITPRFVPWYTSQVCSSCTASLNRRSTKQNIISFLVYSLILFFVLHVFLDLFSYSFNYWVIWFFLDWLIHSFVYSLCFFHSHLILIYLYFLIHIFFIALFNQHPTIFWKKTKIKKWINDWIQKKDNPNVRQKTKRDDLRHLKETMFGMVLG